jgi:hypothetical protein
MNMRDEGADTKEDGKYRSDDDIQHNWRNQIHESVVVQASPHWRHEGSVVVQKNFQKDDTVSEFPWLGLVGRGNDHYASNSFGKSYALPFPFPLESAEGTLRGLVGDLCTRQSSLRL